MCGKLAVVMYLLLAIVNISSSRWQLYKKWQKQTAVSLNSVLTNFYENMFSRSAKKIICCEIPVRVCVYFYPFEICTKNLFLQTVFNSMFGNPPNS